MQSFFQIVKFEYKKILSKKLTKISLLLFLITLIYINNNEIFIHTADVNNNKLSLYELNKNEQNQKIDKIYINTETMINATNLIKEGLKDNKNLSKEKNVNKTAFTEEAYLKYVIPYESTVSFIKYILNPKDATNDYKYLLNYTKNDFDNIYNTRTNILKDILDENNNSFSSSQKDKIFELNNKIKTPFYYENFETYDKFLKDIQVFMIFIIYIIITCISPIFSNDYSNKTYHIISPTKYGKSKLIYAKIFVALSFSILLTFFAQIFSFLNLCLLYGISGFNTNIQLMTLNYLSPYPITVGQLFIIKFIINILITIIVTLISCLISSYSKNSFISIIINFIIIFLPSYLYIVTSILSVENPITNSIRNIILLHPINLIGYMHLITNDMFTIFNKSFELYYVVPVVFIPLSIIFTFCCIKSAKGYKLK